MPKILALDGLADEGVHVFQNAPDFEVDVKPAQKPDELAQIIGEYDGLVVRSGTKVTAEALANAENLKVIGRAGVGTDNVDKDTATKMGIVVMNTPGGNTMSTCEHALALLFSLCRNIPQAHASMEAGRWDRKLFMGTEVCGKTLGIVGVGRIGGAVAKRAQAYEMNVVAYDPILTKVKADALGVELVSLDALLERADFITVHAPKTEKTDNMIRKEHFQKMKNTARIVNTARGGIVNENDLAEALKNKEIAGAALDVYTKEPLEENPFIGLDNIVMTPHLAASTEEAQETVAVDVAQQMVDYLTTGAIVNAVNVPSLDAKMRKKLKPLLYLGERLGQFLASYMEGAPDSIDIEYHGDVGVRDTYPITASILTGFLTPIVDSVNVVSAPSLLEEHGIDFSETRKAKPSDYAFQILVRVKTDQESHSVAGTLFGEQDPRICGINGFRVDAVPEGWMLICMNEDKPSVLGHVALTIGESGANIANLVLGRDEPGKKATTVLNLDGPISDDILNKIQHIPHVEYARLVELK